MHLQYSKHKYYKRTLNIILSMAIIMVNSALFTIASVFYSNQA